MSELEKLRTIVLEFELACKYDALMSGPKFKGYNRSALDRARKLLEEMRG